MRQTILFMLLLVLGAAHADDAACVSQRFEGSTFTVCRYDSRVHDFELVVTDRAGRAYRGFGGLKQRPEAKKVRFAMNAGMFDGNGLPIGLYVENGRSRHPVNTRDGGGNFHLKPNGIFSVAADGTPRVETTDAFLSATQSVRGFNGHFTDGRSVKWATQSGPMLVIDGSVHPQISPDGPSRLLRNGVGVADSHTAYFVISEEPVSFGRLARFFRDGLKCPNALYFDGVVSSLWWPGAARSDSQAPLGPMAIVVNKT